MQVEKTVNGIVVSDIINGYRVKKLYQGYLKITHVKKLFREEFMPKKKVLKKGSTILMIGKRWFDKVNGNTYHSAKLYVNGELISYVPMAYGYGDHYQQTCREELIKAFKIPGFSENTPVWQLRDIYDTNKIKVVTEVSDVSRRKDL